LGEGLLHGDGREERGEKSEFAMGKKRERVCVCVVSGIIEDDKNDSRR
jgi:hypothetical protein